MSDPVINKLIIRFAEPGDIDYLAENLYIKAAIIKRKIEWKEIFIVESDNQTIGFLQLEYLWSSVPYIALIRVAAGHRKRGVGKSLLAFTGRYLRENGHTVLYSSSQADEPDPQAWHRAVGFEECGIISGINEGVGEIFFRKDI